MTGHSSVGPRPSFIVRVPTIMLRGPVFILCLTSCGQQQPDTAPVLVQPVVVDTLAFADTTVAVEHITRSVTDTSRAMARKPVAVPPDDGCSDHFEANGAAVRFFTYSRSGRKGTSELDLAAELEGAWHMAEQSAGRSISDDFERGISTEHVDMPDTIDVYFMRYRDCKARQPDKTEHYRVWRADDGSCAWRALR